jgi:hypothetical protein
MVTALLALALQQTPQQQQQPAIARVVVAPAPLRVTVGDSVRLQVTPLDANGRPVSGAIVRFAPAGGFFEGSLDSTGMVHAGAVGTLPVMVSAFVPGSAPSTQLVEVSFVAGPASRIEIAPATRKLLVGQRARLEASVFSAAGDQRNDAVSWTSSTPSVANVAPGGFVTAVAPGKAIITTRAGAATGTAIVEVLPPSTVSALSLMPDRVSARTGDVIVFRVSARDASGKGVAGLSPTWLFAPGRGEIGQDGSFVAYEPGTYQVTASFGSRTADAFVTVSPRDVRRETKVVGRLPRTAINTSEVWIHPNGKVAYLGTEFGGDRVYAIDISDPSKPTVVDSIMVNARVINDMMTTADGNYLVFTREGASDRKNGIVIADVHDPLHPKQISEFTDGVTAGVHSAYVYTQPKFGTHVYLTNDGTGALHIIDITDPYHPKEASRFRPRTTPSGVMLHDVDVRDGMVYGAWWNDGLVILDVGNGIKGGTPSNPKLVSQYKYNLDSLYKDVEKEGGKGFIRGTHTAWRHGKYVFIADEVFGNDAGQALFSGGAARAHGRLQVIDVSDMEHPKSVAWYEPESGGVHNVWVVADTLYLGAYNAGFHAFDISGELRGDLRAQGREMASLITTSPDGKIPNAPFDWGVVVNPKDGLAYVNDFNNGLWVVRLEPKAKPVP